MPMNVPDPLLPLFEQGLLDEVIRPLMSGKEASVYLVRSRGTLCVAKVYKDAQHRSFRQRAAYAEGRQVRSSRERRAMEKGSGYGKSRLEAAWQSSEVQTLQLLYDAGVRVPVPYYHAESVLLMELVADADGEPAPRLFDFQLSESDALLVHQVLIRDVVRMLCAGVVHGDLSEYNILIAVDGPVIIDLPQATQAAANSNSERLFLRDVENLANYLGRFAPSLKKTRFGPEIWDLYTRAQLHPDSEVTGHFQDKRGRVDTAGVIAEIHASAKEAEVRARSAQPSSKRRPEEKRPEARRPEAQRSEARRAEAPRAEGQRRPAQRPEAQRHQAQRPEAQRHQAQRPEAGRHQAQRPEAQRHQAQRSEAQRHQAQRPEAERHQAQRPEAQRHRAQRPEAQRSETQPHRAQRSEAQRSEAQRSEARRPEAQRSDARRPVVAAARPGRRHGPRAP